MKKFWHGLNIETSAIGFGCWQIAGNHLLNDKPHGWGNVPEQEAIRLLCHAMNHGIDFFDTAPSYNNGKSEELIGKAKKISKSSAVICTKVILKHEEINRRILDEDFQERIHKSLKRLGSDCIDILLIHNPPDDLPWSNFDFTSLFALQQQGKIRSFGVSSRSLKGALLVAKEGFGQNIEWVYNIFERRPEKELFPLMERNKMNFIARSPLSRGFINPSYLHKVPVFSDTDFRSTLPEDWIRFIVEGLQKIHQSGILSEQLVSYALNYLIEKNVVKSAIVGIKRDWQLQQMLDIISQMPSASRADVAISSFIPECYPPWA